MKQFVKNWLLFLIPFFLLLICYFIFDPFKVIWSYDNYYVNGDGVINRDYVSTTTYINKKDSFHYDSFIFGNSRSMFYKVDDWKKYIDSTSICYHFSESGGSVNGLLKKLELIDNYNEKIRNALIIVDYDLLSQTQREGRLFLTTPQLVDNQNLLTFHIEHIKAWFDIKFLYYWTYYHIYKKYTPNMRHYIEKGNNYTYYDNITNEEPFTEEDSLIKKGLFYNESRMRLFSHAQFPDSIYPQAINEERKKLLYQVHSLFTKHHTKYKIIINPLYFQIRINPNDYNCLCDVFGKNNVYDFSGVNKWTSDFHNYYEPSHYTPQVSNEIMDSIYSNLNNN